MESDDGWTALHASAVRGHAEVVAILLGAGADVDACDDSGITPLWNAAGPSPSKAAIRLLLEAGADPNAKDAQFGWTPLIRAVDAGNLDAVELLLAAGASASPHADGWTLLMDAAERGSVSIAQALIGAGVDVNAVCEGRTAADIAHGRGHTDLARLLAEAMNNRRTQLPRCARRSAPASQLAS